MGFASYDARLQFGEKKKVEEILVASGFEPWERIYYGSTGLNLFVLRSE